MDPKPSPSCSGSVACADFSSVQDAQCVLGDCSGVEMSGGVVDFGVVLLTDIQGI